VAEITKSKQLDVEAAEAWLLEITKQYAKATERQDRQYIPYPASWLNGERYLDDPKEWIKNESGKHANRNSGLIYTRDAQDQQDQAPSKPWSPKEPAVTPPPDPEADQEIRAMLDKWSRHMDQERTAFPKCDRSWAGRQLMQAVGQHGLEHAKSVMQDAMKPKQTKFPFQE